MEDYRAEIKKKIEKRSVLSALQVNYKYLAISIAEHIKIAPFRFQ